MYTNEEDRKTALHFAAQKDDKVVMRKMIERGLFWVLRTRMVGHHSMKQPTMGVRVELEFSLRKVSHTVLALHIVFALPAVIASPSHSHKGGIATNICIALIGLISLAY